jgi:hypothetical protein
VKTPGEGDFSNEKFIAINIKDGFCGTAVCWGGRRWTRHPRTVIETRVGTPINRRSDRHHEEPQ